VYQRGLQIRGDHSVQTLFPAADVCRLVQVVDGHYPHVMPHSSNLSFWEKGMTSDIGHTWLIGHKRLGNSTELGWEGMSQHLGSASRPNSALYQQMYSEGQRAQWGSF